MESTLRIMENIDCKRIIKKDNLSIYNEESKGQEIIFAICPKKNIFRISEMQMFLTNVYNSIGLKHNCSFYIFEEVDKYLILGKIFYVEQIATLISGDFKNIILKPGMIIEPKKEDLSVVNNSGTEAIMRHIAIILCPTKEIMDYAIENDKLHISTPANIPENIWRC